MYHWNAWKAYSWLNCNKNMLRLIMQWGNSPENGKGPQRFFILWLQKLYKKNAEFCLTYLILNITCSFKYKVPKKNECSFIPRTGNIIFIIVWVWLYLHWTWMYCAFSCDVGRHSEMLLWWDSYWAGKIRWTRTLFSLLFLWTIRIWTTTVTFSFYFIWICPI